MGQFRPLAPAYIMSGVAVLIAALGSLLYMETATVKVSIVPTRLQANATLTGGQSGYQLVTTRIQASVTESQHGTASSEVVSPTYATGQVDFSCSPCPAAVTFKEGQVVATANGVRYEVQSQREIISPNNSVLADVRAENPGAGGNTARDTITVIVNPPQPNLKVTNPTAVTGGTDAYTIQVIQQSDFDTVRTALALQVETDLDNALEAKAQGQSFVEDGPPTLNLSSDHSVGDQVSTFTITITGSISAIAFSKSSAQALLRAALEQKIPNGYALTSDPIQTSYQIQAATSNGEVTVTGTAIGYVAPKLSPAALRAEIRGLTLDQARARLLRHAPGSHVDIRVQPVLAWWLPLVTDHITLTIVVVPAPQGVLALVGPTPSFLNELETEPTLHA